MGSRTAFLALILAAAPVFEPVALARPADDDGGGRDGGGKGKRKNADIQETGIESFDNVFAQVAPIDATLDGVDSSLRSAKVNLNNALGLERGTPLKDGIAELQNTAGNKVNVVMRGQVPTLAVTDAVPSNVQAAVDAVNGLTRDLGGSLDDLQALPTQVDALVRQTQGFPAALRSEFAQNGAGMFDTLFQLPKVSNALSADMDIVTGLPDRVTGLTNRTTDILGVVQSSFSPARR